MELFLTQTKEIQYFYHVNNSLKDLQVVENKRAKIRILPSLQQRCKRDSQNFNLGVHYRIIFHIRLI